MTSTSDLARRVVLLLSVAVSKCRHSWWMLLCFNLCILVYHYFMSCYVFFMFYFFLLPSCWNVVAQLTLPCGDLIAKEKTVNVWHVCCLWDYNFMILQDASPESSITICLCMNLVPLSLLKQHIRWCLPETTQATSMIYVHVDIAAKYWNTWAIHDRFKWFQMCKHLFNGLHW